MLKNIVILFFSRRFAGHPATYESISKTIKYSGTGRIQLLFNRHIAR
jgi:hypothetical protein